MSSRSASIAVSLSAFALATLVSGVAHGEGAVRVLDCTITQQCNAEGDCEATTSPVTFTMEPQGAETLESGGSARHTLSYADVRVEMRALSDVGPFLWENEQERDTLLASSQTHWLWHRLTLGASPEASVGFLVCTFRQ